MYLELAVEFGLPLRLGDASSERIAGFPFRRLAAEEGAVFPDHVVRCPPGTARRLERALFELAPGVTELCVHPAVDTDELRAATTDWAHQVEDHASLHDPSLQDLISRAGATRHELARDCATSSAAPELRRRSMDLQLGTLKQIAQPVEDLERAVAFYRDTLQVPFIGQFGPLAFFDLDGVRLLLEGGEAPT